MVGCQLLPPSGARNTSDMNIGEQDVPARIGCERADTQRRPYALPIDDSRAGKPRIAPRDVMESIDRFKFAAPVADLQHARIIRSDVNDIANRHAARELEVACGKRGPLAIRCTPRQRMAAGNRERAAAPVRGEPPNRYVRKLVIQRIAADCEQAVVPRRHKYCLASHRSLFPHQLTGRLFSSNLLIGSWLSQQEIFAEVARMVQFARQS